MGRALLGRGLALLGPRGRGASATSVSYWNDPGKQRPHSELFFFLVRKVPVALTQTVQFEPFVSAETLKACALIGLHLFGSRR